MMSIFETYTVSELMWVALAIFMLGIGKGGFPLGGVALPALILMWPEQATAARSVVAFMLPLLSAMDFVSISFYWKSIEWKKMLPLVPGTLVGVAIASVLFVSDSSSLVTVSDRVLKIFIGSISIIFVAFRMVSNRILRRIEESPAAAHPDKYRSFGMGAGAGLLSTISHSAGPIAIMYFLPQRLGKLGLAGTMAGFFWGLNLVKLIPFALLGRLEVRNLVLAAWMVPVIPLGVGAGYLLVRALREKHYIGLVQAVLVLTAVLLIRNALLV